MTNRFLLEIAKNDIRKNLLRFTRRAFGMISASDKPRILDIGCGTGVPTLELTALCNGHITAIDNDYEALDILLTHIEKESLTDRIEILQMNISEINFAPESFDIIWSEGSIQFIGFAEGLAAWRKLLAPGGFMAIHADDASVAERIALIEESGFSLTGKFTMSAEIWWSDYFEPLKNLVAKLRKDYANNNAMLKLLEEDDGNVKMFEADPDCCQSAFYVMQKT